MTAHSTPGTRPLSNSIHAIRGSILHFLGDPEHASVSKSHEYYEDGLLLIEDGHILDIGQAESLLPHISADARVTEYTNALITPGFVDVHTHYPQFEMIGSYGEQLLEWLESYAYPAERRFYDYDYAKNIATKFLNELIRNGTTTAMVFGSVHPASVNAFFACASRNNMRMICGKVMMDRNAPKYLTDTPETGYSESKELIQEWHCHNRLSYAVTPRFAPSCSDEQLAKAGQLLREYPDLYLQTHLSADVNEIELVRKLFPTCRNYLEAYDNHGMLGPRSVFAHCVHLTDSEWMRLAESNSVIAFCPSSNMFMGAGLFNLERAERNEIRVGVGTDVGGGTSFSQLMTLNQAYKTQQLQGKNLSPLKCFYLITLGGARALSLDAKIGNFAPGKEADFVVLDYNATPMLSMRFQSCKSLSERLFAICMLGDDRTINSTYVMGERIYSRE